MPKPFISKNNPYGESELNGELFKYQYLYPRYWLTWIFLGVSFLIAYLPKYFRIILGQIIGKINGLYPSPGAFFIFKGERYKILKAEQGNGNGNCHCL